jgi:hypothetical protein
MEGYAALMLLIYPIGVPLLYWVIMFRDRHWLRTRISDQTENNPPPAFTKHTRMLWEHYKPEQWWWEVFECARRLMLTGVLVFIKPDSISQIAWALLMGVLGLSCNIYWLPYPEAGENFLSIAANTVLVFNLVAGILIKTNAVGEAYEELEDQYLISNRAAFDGVLVLVNVMVCVIAVFFLVIQTMNGREQVAEKNTKRLGGITTAEDIEMTVWSKDDGSSEFTNPAAGYDDIAHLKTNERRPVGQSKKKVQRSFF